MTLSSHYEHDAVFAVLGLPLLFLWVKDPVCVGTDRFTEKQMWIFSVDRSR